MRRHALHSVVFVAWLSAFLHGGVAWAQAETLEVAEEAAFRNAVEHMAPRVVRIETIGGRERIGKTRIGTGPTSGLLLDEQGHVLSSSYGFLGKPSSILVRLPDGSRQPAKLMATDYTRMIVLLRIESDGPLQSIAPLPAIVPKAEMRVGQWALAVGRTFDAEHANMAVGILSAMERCWGKALQTDAAVSPNNYGGPLIDIHGRPLGLLVPLAPDASNEIAGLQWYDSGIGFAIDMEYIMGALSRLKKGEDLRPGLLGLGFAGEDASIAEPIVANCHPHSEAARKGIQPGDRIAEVDGAPIERVAQLKVALGRHYAGETIRLAILRKDQRTDYEITLTATLPKLRLPEAIKATLDFDDKIPTIEDD